MGGDSADPVLWVPESTVDRAGGKGTDEGTLRDVQDSTGGCQGEM